MIDRQQQVESEFFILNSSKPDKNINDSRAFIWSCIFFVSNLKQMHINTTEIFYEANDWLCLLNHDEWTWSFLEWGVISQKQHLHFLYMNKTQSKMHTV